MISQQALDEAAARLEAAGVVDAKQEAKRLLGLAFPRKYTDYNEVMDGGALERFEAFVARREAREPFSHIAGGRHFWKHRFLVTPGVLDPRPDTETLVELALKAPFSRVLDLGAGSGCIVLSLVAEQETALGLGTDVSEAALYVARQNAEEIERVTGADVTRRVTFLISDWFEHVEGRFDLIVSNPPYISADELAGLSPEVHNFEPHSALTDYADGLTHYRTIAADALAYLAPQGRVLVEIGPTQGEQVMALFRAAGFENVAVHPDIDGRDRVVSAQQS